MPTIQSHPDLEPGLRFRWQWRNPDAVSQNKNTSSDFPPLILRLLTARNLLDSSRFDSPQALPAEINHLLHGSLHDLHDGALLPGITQAAQQLRSAIQNKKQIVIYGDYDVDGITATAILYHSLKLADPDANVRTYVPHRLNEGYGLNPEALDTLKSRSADLVISVDCGINATQAAQHAKSIGLDLIITDHHNLPENESDLPDAAVLVHPRLPGSTYPFADLCGAGVAFKLAWQFAILWCGSQNVSESFRNLLTNLLAFAALGTIADVVPLIDENRTIARFGLKMMRHTSFPGLNALIKAAGLDDESKIDSEAVGFRLAPRLNAAGRMGHAAEAVKLFTTATPEEASTLANDLNAANLDRQKTEKQIFDTAVDLAQSSGQTEPDNRIIILAHENWHPGVVGIVCSRLVERFGRPAILMERKPDIIKGSGRSIDGYSMHHALSTVADKYLTTWGGHDMAAGLSLKPKHFDDFVKELTHHANENITLSDLTPKITIDAYATLDEFDQPTVRTLAELGPFGRKNPRPLFLVQNLRLQSPPQEMGANGKHLALKVTSKETPTKLFRIVGWNMNALACKLAAGRTIDAILQPKLNTWQGRTNVEAELRDFRINSQSYG